MKHLGHWCRVNSLVLNVDKTKEIVVDFRRSRPSHTPLLINDTTVEVVSSTNLGGAHPRQPQLVTPHLLPGEEVTAAPALPAEDEQSLLAPIPSYRPSTEGPSRARWPAASLSGVGAAGLWTGNLCREWWGHWRRSSGPRTHPVKDSADSRCLSRAHRILFRPHLNQPWTVLLPGALPPDALYFIFLFLNYTA